MTRPRTKRIAFDFEGASVTAECRPLTVRQLSYMREHEGNDHEQAMIFFKHCVESVEVDGIERDPVDLEVRMINPLVDLYNRVYGIVKEDADNVRQGGVAEPEPVIFETDRWCCRLRRVVTWLAGFG